MTMEKMNLRRQALDDLNEWWTLGGNATDGEQYSEAFQKLSKEEKDLVRMVFLAQFKSEDFPEGYNGEEGQEDYL